MQIIKQKSDSNTSSHTSVHKFESLEPKCRQKKKGVDFDKFLNIYFVYLGTKDKYSIFKDMLCNLCFISHKLLFNAEIYHTPFKRY